jgi:hypothetical protein
MRWSVDCRKYLDRRIHELGQVSECRGRQIVNSQLVGPCHDEIHYFKIS